MGKKKTSAPAPNAQDIYNRSTAAYNTTIQPSALENEMAPVSQGFMNNYNSAVGQNKQDYGNVMGGYQSFKDNFNATNKRPAELGEGYGYLREAMPGYRDFAATGGYSPTDVQELRARGTAPIRAAYGNTMMEMDRARSLGGNNGSPNYIAAASRAQRDLPGQMADAQTTVNAGLADSIREGKKFGLQGITGTGATMGGLASDDAGRELQAQDMNMRAQLGALGGQTSLYGTTPGMSNMFGNQALNAYNQRGQLEGQRNQYGLGLLDSQSRTQENQQEGKGTPWWKTALSIAGTVAPYAAMAMSSRKAKYDIKEVKNTSRFSKHLKDLPLYTWKYKGDDTTHFGPIAEEWKKEMGVGDGKTLHLADVMGVMLAAAKENTDA